MSNSVDEDHLRPLPAMTPEAEPYWAACGEHRFVIQHCDRCDRYQFPPRLVCQDCWESDQLVWHDASGHGTVYSYTAVHRPPTPAFQDRVPYVVALIELDEGPRMMANIVGCEPADVAIDARVAVGFEDLRDGVALPVFTIVPSQ